MINTGLVFRQDVCQKLHQWIVWNIVTRRRSSLHINSSKTSDKDTRLLPLVVLMVHTADTPRGRPAQQRSDFRKLNTDYTTWRHSVRTLGDFPITLETCWWYLLVYAVFFKTHYSLKDFWLYKNVQFSLFHYSFVQQGLSTSLWR